MIKLKVGNRILNRLSKRMLNKLITWLLTFMLCWQSVLPVLADKRDEWRAWHRESSRSKKNTAIPGGNIAVQTNVVNVTTVSAASFETTVAPGSIMAAFGTALATKLEIASTIPLPESLAGTRVVVRDSLGVERLAKLFFVSSNQVNYLIPQETASGTAIVTIVSGNGVISQGVIQVNVAGPGIFTANSSGRGVPAANLFRLRNGQLFSESLAEPGTGGEFRPRPIDPGPETDRLFLVLYLTGLRGAPDPNQDGNSNESVGVIIGNQEFTPAYAGKQGYFEGLDQINVELPRFLVDRGRLSVTVTTSGLNSSNTVEIDFGPIAGSMPPQITSFGVSEVIAGQTVTVNGSGFSSNPAENIVRLGVSEATVVLASYNQLTVRVPFGAETDTVSVRTPQGTGVSTARLRIATSLSGHIETTSRQPLANVTVKVVGTNLSATTDVEGVFVLPGLTVGGDTVLEIDGRTALPAESYPKLRLRVNIVANRDNQLIHPIALQYAAGTFVTLNKDGNTADSYFTVHNTAQENLTAITTAQAGNIFFDLPSGTAVNFTDGATVNQLVLTQLEKSRTPFSLPKGRYSSNILQIAPYGATFSQGGRIVFPNNDGLEPGATVKLFKLDQDLVSPTLGSFVESGAATVSADGKTVETQSGVITESGCYFVSAPRTVNQTLIGRVVTSNGNPVRRAFVTARGQEFMTDGDGSFVLRLVPTRLGEQVQIDVDYLRPNASVARIVRSDFVVQVKNQPAGYVRVMPDLAFPTESGNRPPAIFCPTSLDVAAGQMSEVDVAVSDPDVGQTVQLTLSGSSLATLSPTVVNSYKLRVAPSSGDVGSFTLILRATDNQNATTTQTITINVTDSIPKIIDFNPKTDTVGSTVILTGVSLKSAFGNPIVTFAGPNNRRLQAFVSAATPTEVRVTVPNAAVTGTIDLKTSIGTAITGGAFTVDPSQNFMLSVENPTATALQGGTGTFVIRMGSNTPNFSQLARLSLTGLPSGATVKFQPEQISAGAISTLSLILPSNIPAQSYNLTVNAKALVDGNEMIRSANASLEVLVATQTTLSGRVLSTKNMPLSGVTISLDGKSATTDAAGAFLLSGISAGQDRPVSVNGATVTGTTLRYPAVAEPITIVANQANVVPYTFYLPPIDTVNEVTIVPNQQTVITTPEVPGFQQKIPPNAGLLNRDGTPVTRTSVTSVEMDRTPAPLPPNVGTNIVFTSQPGGARPTQGANISVTYPNLAGLNPGTRVELYNFDPDLVRWYIYGYGRVSADGRLIVPEPGVGLPFFSWHFPNASPNGNPSPDSCVSNKTNTTVDLATGMKIEKVTDISIGGVRGGLELTRIHTSDLPGSCNNCPFGRGTTHNFDIHLSGTFQENGAGRLVLPEQITGRLFSYDRTDKDGSLIFITRETTDQLASFIRKLTNGTYEYRMSDGMVYLFDASGRIYAIIDNNGNTTTLSYTGSNLTQVSDAVGRSLTFNYDANSRIINVVDPLQRVWRYSYEVAPGEVGSPGLKTVTDPMGNITRYSYVAGGRLGTVMDERSNVTKKITYSNGRVIRQEYADGGFEEYSYKLAGRLVSETTVTDNQGRAITRRFNAAGYVTAIVDELGQTTEIKRDLITNVALQVIGSCGCLESDNTYDTHGLVKTITDRLGQKTEYDYAPNFSFISQIKDALGRLTKVDYDGRGNLAALTDTLGRTTRYVYDSMGQLRSMTDPLNHTTKFEYDANGYVSQRIDPLNNVTYFEHDLVGRLKKIIDAEERVISIVYDSNNRISSVTDPAGIKTNYEYDAADNRTAIINAQGKRWKFTYDSKNRLSWSTNPLNQTIQYRYDTDDNLIELISPSGRTVSYEYDLRGMRSKITDPIKGEIRFIYDNNRNLAAMIDQRSNTTTFTRDELYRLIAHRDPLGRITTYSYDAVNNLVQTVDRLGRRTTIVRDALNRPETITYPDATVGYSFDHSGRLTQINDSQSGLINWDYDHANRLLAETTPLGVVRYTYNKANQRVTMTAADQPVVIYGYDTAGRLSMISHDDETYTWNYDDLSRVSMLSRSNGLTTSYEYDYANKIRRILHTNAANVVLEDLKYGFNIDDEIESITSPSISTLLPALKVVSPADAANRILRFGSTSYIFNDEGQTRTKTDSQGTTTYDWDSRGRLTSVTLPNGQAVNYDYDPLGRRSSRSAAGLTTKYLYDGQDVVVDSSTGGLVMRYLNGPGIDNKLRQSSSNYGSLYFLQDHLGSTVAMTNRTGSVLERIQYEPFGASPNTSLTRYGFTGREADSATGLLYYRARWYDAQQGRFLSEDPIHYNGGLNLYTYTLNNPYVYRDYDGTSPFLITAGAGLVIGGIAGGLSAWYFGGDWRQGAATGAVSGVVFGATLGFASPAIAASLGGGMLGGAVASSVSAAVGDVASQGFGLQMGWSSQFDLNQLAASSLGGVVFGAVGVRPSIALNQQVTSWAAIGSTPDLNPGRWVMTGGNSIRNWILTGRFNKYPYVNSITGDVPGVNLAYPPGCEAIKGIFGQRVIK